MDKGEEKRAASAKTKRKPPARKETASSDPGEMLPEPGPAPLDSAAEVPHRPDTAPAEAGSHPGDRFPTPQPEAVRNTRSRRRWKKRPQKEDQEVLKQPSDPLSDEVGQAPEPDDANVVSPKKTGGDPNPPEGEIIDLTIKEESPPTTPLLSTQVPESDEGVPGLRAGWVRLVVFSPRGSLTRD